MSLKVVLSLAIVALFAASVSADDFGGSVSPNRATLESAVATVAPIAVGAGLIAWGTGDSGEDMEVIGGSLCLIGAWFGPSFGHFYARQAGRAGLGITIRTAGLATIVVGAVVQATSEDGGGLAPAWGDSPGTVIDEGKQTSDLGGAMILIGGSVMVASAVFDIVTAGSSARKTNESIRFGTTLDIAPVYLAQHKTAGIGLSLRF